MNSQTRIPRARRLAASATPDITEASWTPRARCYRCHKPRLTCVCASVPLIENRTQVFILQHPRESFHPIGTARFAELGLRRVRLERARPSELQTEPPPCLPKRCAVLYPAPHARPIESIPARARPDCLIALDGTWHHARTLYRDTPWLRTLPAYALTPERPSRYRIRREPSESCVSTIEAIVAALKMLEPETPGLDALLEAFDRMIDVQSDYIEQRSGTPRTRRRRAGPFRRLPRCLVEQFERLVIAYGESVLIGPPLGARQVLQWTAVRPTTGECFERIVRPEGDWVRPWHLRHMRLGAEELQSGTSQLGLAESWAHFVGRHDVVAAWNASSLDLLRTFDSRSQTLLLKGAYCNLGWGRCGTLDQVVLDRALTPAPLPVHGRASARLANSLAVSQLLHAYAHGGLETDPPPAKA